MDIFCSLNDRQLSAVTATEGYVRVIAGAGSGKTKLLVSRYAYLVSELGIDTANILCVTFTNKAAAEMKQRIRALLGQAYDTGLICTYHGFCARLLREDGGRLFLDRGFQILDPVGQKSILEEIYRKMELKLDHASFESILKKLGRFKSDIGYVAAMTDPAPRRILPEIVDTDHRIMEEFMQRQKALHTLDFHDLISYALYLLEQNEKVRQKWQERLNYIMVDEFQDSSHREMRLVDLLAGGYGNVMIVGDPDQNIYEWRGSDVRLLVDFDRNHTPTKTIFLDRNYRSTPQILKCANTLIDKNKIRIKKDLFTRTPDGQPVVHLHASDDTAEAMQIINYIRDIKKETGRPYTDFALLYRSGFLSRTLEKQFTQEHIPYEIFGGVRFWRRMEVLDVIAYLKLIATGEDECFLRVVNVPRRKIGRGKIGLIRDWRDNAPSMFADVGAPGASVVPGTLFDALAAHVGDPAFQGSGAGDFVTLIQSLRQDATGMRVSELVRAVCERSGYEQYIRALGDEERLNNLAEFKRVADEFEKNFGEDLSLPAFLTQVALQAGEGDDRPRDAVKFMTIHAAKGLEFPVVFVVGFTEGIFPSAKTIEERKQAGLEEERRLCYVAITRAEERLFLTDSEGLSENGIKKLPSRFLHDIGEENYTRVGKISDDLKSQGAAYAARLTGAFDNRDADVNQTDRAEGDVVQHHIFGQGKIIGRDEKRGSYIVKFDALDKPRHIAGTYFDVPHEMPPVSAAPEAPPEIPASPEPTSEAPPEILASPEPTPEAPPEIPASPEPTPEVPPEILAPPEPTPEAPRPKAPSRAKKKPVAEISAELTEEQKQVLRETLASTDNLWKREDVPHAGWQCTGITDLGAPVGICQMCGDQIIRYVHHMTHPDYHSLGVGCVCTGRMEGDPAAARTRERNFKNRQAREERFLARQWKLSGKGNQYLKVQGHTIVLYEVHDRQVWRYSMDQVFRKGSYPTREDACRAVFEELETLSVTHTLTKESTTS